MFTMCVHHVTVWHDRNGSVFITVNLSDGGVNNSTAEKDIKKTRKETDTFKMKQQQKK